MVNLRLLDHIEPFLLKAGITATAFGRAAVNDPSFVFTLRQGRSPREVTIERVQNFIAAQRD
jgi:hypothetical protein